MAAPVITINRTTPDPTGRTLSPEQALKRIESALNALSTRALAPGTGQQIVHTLNADIEPLAGVVTAKVDCALRLPSIVKGYERNFWILNRTTGAVTVIPTGTNSTTITSIASGKSVLFIADSEENKWQTIGPI